MSVSSPGPVPTSTAGTPVTAKTKASATDPSDKAKTAINADFDTFLKLLTTQMQNQDPLQPMESTQFVAQLASFSAVEQQIRTNDQLGSIFGALSTGNANLAEWIGREVRAPQSADFTGQPIEVDVTAKPGADRTVLVVTNDFGREVSRTQVDATSGSVTWDGTDSLGTTVADGRYGFRLDSYDGDALVGSDTGRVFASVEEVRIVDGSPMLVVGDGTQLALDEVSAVR